MAIEMSAEEFDVLVDDALSGIPAELTALVDNVVIMTEDWPPPDQPDLLGYYDGVPLTERDSMYGGVLPDRIVIFREAILQICWTVDDVVREVNITVVHEIAHHFGIDDDQLHRLGYG
jgi:predicted Zn-dependent protease with MMP-like domain